MTIDTTEAVVEGALEPSETVLGTLGSIIYRNDYYSTGTRQAYDAMIETVFESCFVGENAEELELDADDYIAELESLIWGLINQRDLLFTALEANFFQGGTAENQPLIKAMGIDLFKKFIIFAASGIDAATSSQARQFYSEESFQAACKIVQTLPVEWRERGARFVEVYAANYYNTEFKSQTL